ncbi:hypothetical protein [Xanthomonas melonis]|uniref:hypothetical protein n=1 Tax=Xanthomonas melonis TaxID=56456 RepID=UPI003EB84BB2
MHPFLATAAVALLGATLPALAADPLPVKFGQTTHLHQEISAAGESLDAFVTRIAPRARAASVSTRTVVCGEILGAGPYSLTLKTDGQQDWCEVRKTAAPYVLVNGIAKDARADHFTLVHRFRPGYLITPWSIKFQDQAGVRRL